MLLRILLTAGLLSIAALPAAAHPHVWVTSRSDIVFDSDRKVTAIRQTWSFDEAYSAFVTQGLDINGDGALSADELKELARTNVESLVEFNYFTQLKAGGVRQTFKPPQDYSLSYKDKILTLTFLLPLAQPVPGKVIGLEVYDPTYFVSFAMDPSPAAVTLAAAPAGCAINVTRPKQEIVDLPQQKSLSEAFFNSLSPNSDFGLQFANKAIIACP